MSLLVAAAVIQSPQIPIGVHCSRPASLVVTHASYEFFALLPATESLAVRGRRLNDTPIQRQGKVYAPDVVMKIEVEEAGQRMHAHFVDDRHLVLAQGELTEIKRKLAEAESRHARVVYDVSGGLFSLRSHTHRAPAEEGDK